MMRPVVELAFCLSEQQMFPRPVGNTCSTGPKLVRSRAVCRSCGLPWAAEGRQLRPEAPR